MKLITPITLLVIIGGGVAIITNDYVQYGPGVAAITGIGFCVLVFTGYGIYILTSNGLKRLRSRHVSA